MFVNHVCKLVNRNFISFYLLVVRIIYIILFKKREIKLLCRQVQNLKYSNFRKRWLDLITDIV